ncbi:hypothetical protein KBI33_02345 [Candidatus Shapirobacteria bacterium]|nr:hypothetical protein [Candidatus Shapirobacteria bacterium]
MKKNKNYNNQLLIALSIAAGLLVLGQVAILLLFGGGGVEAAIVADKKAALLEENEELEKAITQKTSLKTLQERASQKGFSPAKEVKFLETDNTANDSEDE